MVCIALFIVGCSIKWERAITDIGKIATICINGENGDRDE
jgi:hypothetical protein